jgi:hypothetical protein
MQEEQPIQFLEHSEINKEKWDERISESPNGLIYAYSFYLDEMSPKWHALVVGDYQFVMPLTWKRKFGITYLYQPFLSAQLGVFGKNVDKNIVASFIRSIPGKFKYIDIYLNEANQHDESQHIYHRTNFLLDLNSNYEALRSAYSENISRNLKKAEQAGYEAKRGIDAKLVMDLALTQVKHRDKNTKENFDRFLSLYQILVSKGMAETYGVISKQGELLSSCIFFRSHKRAYYILVGNNPAGRSGGSSHFLIDSFIRDNAGNDLVLDFEGSDIESLARFYGGYGAKRVSYPGLRINKLPWLLKWMKNGKQ